MNQYLDKQGELLLRQEIKKYLYRSRGMVCYEEQIIIGYGLQYSLNVLCTLLRKENNTIVMEELCFHSGMIEVIARKILYLQDTVYLVKNRCEKVLHCYKVHGSLIYHNKNEMLEFRRITR